MRQAGGTHPVKGSDFKAMCKSGWVEEHINDNEPIVFKRPRVIGRQRIENKEKRRRFSFAVSEEDYKEFAALREAYMLKCGENPTLANHGMLTALRTFNLMGWLEEQESEKQDSDFMMGKDDHVGE